VHALPGKAQFEIRFPRVEGYTQAIRDRIRVDLEWVPMLELEPGKIPAEVEVKGLNVNNQGRLSLSGPGKIDDVKLTEFRARHRMQELVFDLARAVTRDYTGQAQCSVPAHRLFPQIARTVERVLEDRVTAIAPADKKDIFLAPYYGWLIERLVEAIQPDDLHGEAPEVPRFELHRGAGSTSDVDFFTSREVREVAKCHLNYLVADTLRWEQSAAYSIDRHPAVEGFVKNAGLGFAVPYLHNGEHREYLPDFIVRLKGESPLHLILETKGYDPIEDIKRAAAERWVNAVNADGTHGRWRYAIAHRPGDVERILTDESTKN
jgi:type III restriction enzyme